MKNTNKIVIVAVFALLFSGFAFSQAVLKIVPVPGSSPNSLIAINNGPPLLLKNTAARENHWLGLRLVGKKANPDAIGARIAWQTGDLKRSRLKVGGGSYLSYHDPREVLGIGKRSKIDKLEIQWPQPSKRSETFTNLPIDRYITIVEGSGS